MSRQSWRDTLWRRRIVVLQTVSMTAIAAGVVGLALSPTTAQSGYGLDQFPGFGRSDEAALRDDTIAYWEAYERERLVQDCMADGGFQYTPAVAFPQGAMLEVANGLGVTASDSKPSLSPFERNAAYEAGLSPPQREAYNQTLYSESASDIESANNTGIVPSGREEGFKKGGCFGDASATPSIWDLPRALAGQLDELRAEIVSSTDLRAAYKACAEEKSDITGEWPGDVEAIAAEGGADGSEAQRVLTECDAVWRAELADAEGAALSEFVDKNAAELARVVARYEGAIGKIEDDSAFLGYLSEEVAYASP